MPISEGTGEAKQLSVFSFEMVSVCHPGVSRFAGTGPVRHYHRGDPLCPWTHARILITDHGSLFADRFPRRYSCITSRSSQRLLH